jgi:hypothetical protein
MNQTEAVQEIYKLVRPLVLALNEKYPGYNIQVDSKGALISRKLGVVILDKDED